MTVKDGLRRTYPKCAHCGKRVWLDPYGPAWVHFRGSVWCSSTKKWAGHFAEVAAK